MMYASGEYSPAEWNTKEARLGSIPWPSHWAQARLGWGVLPGPATRALAKHARARANQSRPARECPRRLSGATGHPSIEHAAAMEPDLEAGKRVALEHRLVAVARLHNGPPQLCTLTALRPCSRGSAHLQLDALRSKLGQCISNRLSATETAALGRVGVIQHGSPRMSSDHRPSKRTATWVLPMPRFLVCRVGVAHLKTSPFGALMARIAPWLPAAQRKTRKNNKSEPNNMPGPQAGASGLPAKGQRSRPATPGRHPTPDTAQRCRLSLKPQAKSLSVYHVQFTSMSRTQANASERNFFNVTEIRVKCHEIVLGPPPDKISCRRRGNLRMP